MSRQPSMRDRGARPGPYGPDNPPPPPSEPPPRARESRDRSVDGLDGQRMEGRRRPNLAVRRRDYAQSENLRGRERDRGRSRSPVRRQDPRDELDYRGEQVRYRERSPLRRGPVDVVPRKNDRRGDKAESMRCFACNEPGHRAADCKIAARFDRKGCFRCGGKGHIARGCKVRVGDIKTGAEVAADEAKANAGRYDYRDDDEHWSPEQDADNGYNSSHGFGYDRVSDGVARDDQNGHDQDRDARQLHPERLSLVSPRAGCYVEDEVDWDDDALDTVNDAPTIRKSAGRKIPQPEHPRDEEPYNRHERPVTKVAATKHASVPSSQRSTSRRPSPKRPTHEPKLGLPHLQNPKTDEFPPTVYDLRGYDHYIFTTYASKSRPQRFSNGANGKVAPGMYGSEQRHDLGLCFATFLTKKRCEMGVHCPWRHHPLSNSERAWIIEYGRQKGKDFIENVDRWWSFPEVPVPGATMQGRGDDEN